MQSPTNQQLKKFRDAARTLECDDDEDRFKERLRKVVTHKPVPVADAPE